MLRLTVALFLAASAFAETSVADLLERKTVEKIRRLDEALDGVLGVAAIDLTTASAFAYNGDVVFPQASSIKIPILIQVFRAARAGELQLTDSVTLTQKDLVGGSGHLNAALEKGPLKLTVRELVEAMIRTSDNTATNRLIAMVRMERVNRTLDELGLLFTRLRRIMMDSAAAGRDEENVSTPLEMARLVEMIHRGRIIDEAACHEMIGILKLVKAEMRKAVPENVEVAAKPGGIPGVHCETGIVFLPGRPFALSVMGTFLAEGNNPVGEVTRLVYKHFEKLAQANRYGHRLK